ncbi:hypothetical protein [Anabaena sp. CS-542/02]|uniref:hypothetical protein n=1 Tax=Anabaena sp. CS-542/02 TaxID=3021719 RepID=UPI002330831E|nr:hypothetical protein [Anabaena sp. CS-542/02]MDB9445519.1 hypothetical protein [Anabaena sp. CS-542/02]
MLLLDLRPAEVGGTSRKSVTSLAQVGRFEFWSDRFNLIKEKPLIYWWNDEFLRRYAEAPKLGDETDVRVGMQTANNPRFLRRPWEIQFNHLFIGLCKNNFVACSDKKWVPYIKGAAGKIWFEPLSDIILWQNSTLEKQVVFDHYGSNGVGNGLPSRHLYFQKGVAVAAIGANLSGRVHRFRSVMDIMGQSVFPKNVAQTVCLLNSHFAQIVLGSLNPTVHFQAGDIKRLPLFPIESADEIFTQLDEAFTEHEAARETSVEFRQPAPSAWNYAQTWAQTAVDREPGTPLPPYQPTYEQPPATNHISYALGVALCRFDKNGTGIITAPSVEKKHCTPTPYPTAFYIFPPTATTTA